MTTACDHPSTRVLAKGLEMTSSSTDHVVVPQQIIRRSRIQRVWSITWLPYLLLSPTLLGVLVFTLLPAVQTFINSLYQRTLAVREPTFVGLDNYQQLLSSPDFHQIVLNTLAFVSLTSPLCIVLAFALALMVNQPLHGRNWIRLAFFHPVILPMVSAASIWLFLYTPDYGLLAELLRPLGVGRVNWLGTPQLALPAIIVMTIWKQTGFYMLFYLAGLQHLSRDLNDAARIDGASSWQVTQYITIPQLSGITLFVSTMALIEMFQTIDHIYIMTSGGPDDATNVLLFHIYETYFRFGDQGLAFAMTTVLVLILFSLTSINLLLNDRGTYDS
jgi:sn-glycerol 3-phosphate transport system permease protein